MRKLRAIFQSYDVESRGCVIVDRLDDIWLDLGYAGKVPEVLKQRLLAISSGEGLGYGLVSENAFVGEFFQPDFNPMIRIAPPSHTGPRGYHTPDLGRPASANQAASSLRRTFNHDVLQSMPSFDVHVLKNDYDELKEKLQYRDSEIMHLQKQLVLATQRANATIQDCDEALMRADEKLKAEQVRQHLSHDLLGNIVSPFLQIGLCC